MSEWIVDKEKLTIIFKTKKFKHTYYAPNQEIFEKRVSKLESIQGAKPIKLHLGCGHEHFDGYINIDAQQTQATDMVLDCTKLETFKENSVDEILAYHLIEHLPVNETTQTITNWYRILKHGGKLVIECPDLEKVTERFFKTTDFERYYTYNNGPALIYHIYGNQGDQYEFHKMGFTKSALSNLLSKLFENFVFGESHKDYRIDCIHLECTKK